MLSLSNSQILVTAGPTWVPIDSVRVMTSLFSGETGLIIARYFAELGAEVDLLMGPGRAKITKQDEKSLAITRFCYYDELDQLIEQKIKSHHYHIIIHSSAVADYTPKNIFKGKISSAKDNFTIALTPTKKLIDKIRNLSPHSFLVKFKLEVNSNKDTLLDIAHKSLHNSKADLIVVNDFTKIDKQQHIAYIMQPDKSYTQTNNKLELCQQLVSSIENLI